MALDRVAAVLGRVAQIVEQVGAAGEQAEGQRGQARPGRPPRGGPARRRRPEPRTRAGSWAIGGRGSARGQAPRVRGGGRMPVPRTACRARVRGAVGASVVGRGIRGGCGGSGHDVGRSSRYHVSAARGRRLPARVRIFCKGAAPGRTTTARGETRLARVHRRGHRSAMPLAAARSAGARCRRGCARAARCGEPPRSTVLICLVPIGFSLRVGGQPDRRTRASRSTPSSGCAIMARPGSPRRWRASTTRGTLPPPVDRALHKLALQPAGSVRRAPASTWRR